MILFCKNSRKVVFNPVVKVYIVRHKYDTSHWWSNEDYYNFKQHAIINKIYSQIKKEQKIQIAPPPPSPMLNNMTNFIKSPIRKYPIIRGIL